MSRVALLVEDDAEQVHRSSDVLRSCGYEVSVCRTAQEARAAVPGLDRPIDLAVVDRRLPDVDTDEPIDDVGDELLDWLLEVLPDTPFVAFTGYGDKRHIRFATRERGTIPVGDGTATLDKVVHFDKVQTIEFEEYAQYVAGIVDQIDDVDLIVDSTAFTPRPNRTICRMLRRVAQHFGGTSITATPLAGGLSSASTWRCTVRGYDGTPLASVVVKHAPAKSVSPAGGLHTILHAPRVAAPMVTVTGLCDGQRAMVMQLACATPESLMAVMAADEQRAVRLLLPLIQDLCEATAGAAATSMTLERVVAPLISWSDLAACLDDRGIPLPRATLQVTASVAQQHGDLHPGNVLVGESEAVLIDFDSETVASRLLDPITLLLSILFHRDSPFRAHAWPAPEICGDLGKESFADGCPVPDWLNAVWAWVETARTGERELWAVVLGYAARQLEFPDVRRDELATARAVALIQWAVMMLQSD